MSEASATAATRLTRHPAKHTRIYWHAREERYGRYYTASERRNDAFQRHVDLFRVAPELWHVNIMKPSDMPSWCSLPFQRLCRAYLFNSTANAVHLDTILQAREVLQRRWIEFQSWILGNSWTHLRAARRLRRQQDEDEWSHLRVIASDRPNLWQKYAEADEQRPHLNVKKLGVALTKAEMKVLSRTFGRPSLQKGDPDYTYDLTDIILRNRNDQLPLETQVDLVPMNIVRLSTDNICGLANPARSILKETTSEAQP
ncbi:hypothetical protein E5Q_06446 [Mixia osmundae IAM 14324]|uniref:Uncharacterized protein n=1 Tax=Mixia osmundae (strain CBS 9802 / IAM 14324 / JCM 22182 / KY 12970) TaxID=764103 RepID=G7EA83_MIXOS|nr:hypothetical protein E5Q_06446 [Mixia osmundae IAM 14324]